MKRNEERYAIHYGVPCKSVAIVWQKDLFRFLPVGQGDISYQMYIVPFYFLITNHLGWLFFSGVV